jgi:hypothetical protein
METVCLECSYHGYVSNNSIKLRVTVYFVLPQECTLRSPAQQMGRLQLSGLASQYVHMKIFSLLTEQTCTLKKKVCACLRPIT